MQDDSRQGPTRSGPAQIARATWHDVRALTQLDRRCFKPIDRFPWYEFLELCIWPGVIALKAIADRQVIGFIVGSPRRHAGHTVIVTIGVDPDWRGRGIGERLMREVESRSSLPRMRLMVRRSNTLAINLYRKLNYTIVETWPSYYGDGEAAYLMEKSTTN